MSREQAKVDRETMRGERTLFQLSGSVEAMVHLETALSRPSLGRVLCFGCRAMHTMRTDKVRRQFA